MNSRAHNLALIFLAFFLTTPAVARCKPAPAGEDVRFLLALDQPVQIALGSAHKFEALEAGRGPWDIKPLGDVCAKWRIEPSATGVAVNNSGFLTVSNTAPADENFELIADFGHGREARTTIHLYDKARHPLAGYWKQEGLRCPSHDAVLESQPPIQEFVLRPDGRLQVTWTPFETYVDYSGTYKVEGDRIAFTMGGGNAVPKHFRGDARFHLLDPTHLEISGAFFGNREHDDADFAQRTQQCTYTFVKTHEP